LQFPTFVDEKSPVLIEDVFRRREVALLRASENEVASRLNDDVQRSRRRERANDSSDLVVGWSDDDVEIVSRNGDLRQRVKTPIR